MLVRPGKKDADFKVCDLNEIVADPSVDAVAEVMGGVEPAFSYAMAAIRAGKHFVTSNKALVAARGVELFHAANEQGVAFLFSAACGGGVPFLPTRPWSLPGASSFFMRRTSRVWPSSSAPPAAAGCPSCITSPVP